MKNNPEYLHHAAVYIPGGSSAGTHIPQYLTVLPALKCVCLTVVYIYVFKTLDTQRKTHFLHPPMPCDSFKPSTAAGFKHISLCLAKHQKARLSCHQQPLEDIPADSGPEI